MRTPNDAILLRDAHGLPSREAIKRTMLAKFSWLARAEIHEVLAIWDRDILTFFLIGLVLFGLGLVGEYVGRIYEQVRHQIGRAHV